MKNLNKLLRTCLVPRPLSAEKSMGAQGRKGPPVVPRASRLSRETPEEEVDCECFTEWFVELFGILPIVSLKLVRPDIPGV